MQHHPLLIAACAAIALGLTPVTAWAQDAERTRLKLSKDVDICIGGAIQPRLIFDQNIEGGDGSPSQTRALIRRARLKVCGEGPWERVTWFLQLSWDKGNTSLKDAVIDLELMPKALYLRAGQMKVPFSRQFINSALKLEFLERSINHKIFGAGRDIGVLAHNKFEKSPDFEWALGVFNGTGDKALPTGSGDRSHEPSNADPMVVGRIGFNQGGLEGYSEADLEGGPMRFGAGASIRADFNGGLDQDLDTSLVVAAEMDAILKLEGLSLSGSIYGLSSRANDERQIEATGAYLQAGYVHDGFAGFALRYSQATTDFDSADLQELGGAFTLYLSGHKTKWATEAIFLTEEASFRERSSLLIQSQLLVSF